MSCDSVLAQEKSGVARVVQRTVLRAGYESWQVAATEPLDAPPGQGLQWTEPSGSAGSGQIMRMDSSTVTVLLKRPAPATHDPPFDVTLAGITGQAWPTPPALRHGLVVVEDTSLACAVYLAATLRRASSPMMPRLVIAQWAHAPMALHPSRIVVPHMPPGTIAAIPLLEDWSIASRVASTAAEPGCFDGTAAELLEHYLVALDWDVRATHAVWVAGSALFVEAVSGVAEKYGLGIFPSVARD